MATATIRLLNSILSEEDAALNRAEASCTSRQAQLETEIKQLASMINTLTRQKSEKERLLRDCEREKQQLSSRKHQLQARHKLSKDLTQQIKQESAVLGQQIQQQQALSKAASESSSSSSSSSPSSSSPSAPSDGKSGSFDLISSSPSLLSTTTTTTASATISSSSSSSSSSSTSSLSTASCCIQTIQSNVGPVNCCLKVPGSDNLVVVGFYDKRSASRDQTLRIYDIDSGKLVQKLSGHSWSVNCLTALNDGQRFVSGGQDKQIKIWSRKTNADEHKQDDDVDDGDGAKDNDEWVCVQTFNTTQAGAVWSVAESDDNTLLCGTDTCVQVWDVAEGICKAIWKTIHSDYITCLSVSHSNGLVASGSDDETIGLIDYETGQLVTRLSPDKGFIKCLEWLNDDILLCGFDSASIRLFNLASGQWMQPWTGHRDGVLCFAQSDQTVITGSEDETIRIWDSTGANIATLHGHSGAVRDLIPLTNNRVLSVSMDHTIKLWG